MASNKTEKKNDGMARSNKWIEKMMEWL